MIKIINNKINETVKQHLIDEFFHIGLNTEVNRLESYKNKLEKHIDEYEEIKELNYIVEALIIYYSDEDLAEYKNKMSTIWCNLLNKSQWTLYDIRILNAIMFSYNDLNQMVDFVEDAIIQLNENYQQSEYYDKIILTINFNLSNQLLHAKYFNIKEYLEAYDNTIIEAFDNCLTLANRLNNKYLLHITSINKAIFNNDKYLIYYTIHSIKQQNYTKDFLIKLGKKIEKYNQALYAYFNTLNNNI